MELFTVEEINFMCIYNTESRITLIQDIIEAIGDFYDSEMFEIAQSVLDKLSKMGDADFSTLEFYPEYGDDGQEVIP